MAFCGNCGASITQSNGFCGNCGKQISPASQPTLPTSTSVANTSSPGWTPVNPQPAQGPQPVQRTDTMAWSATQNQPQQNAGWNSVPAQPLPATPPPNPGPGWTGAGVAPAPTAAPAMAANASTGLTRNMAGALAYSLGIITGVLFLVLEPYRRDRFVRFHALQAIFYFVFAIAFSIAWSIVVGMVMNISAWVFVVAFPIRMIIRLAMFGFWLFLMYQAYNDKEFRIPILGAIASKQAES